MADNDETEQSLARLAEEIDTERRRWTRPDVEDWDPIEERRS